MKRLVPVTAAALVTAAVVVGVAAAGSNKTHGVGRVDHQAFQVSRSGDTTRSDQFVRLTGTSLPIANRRGPVTATFSGDFTGAPVDVRLRVGTDGPILGSGPAHFDPSSGTTSFSFTFGGNVGSCAHLEVEWRSPTGEEASFTHGNLVASFRKIRSETVCR